MKTILYYTSNREKPEFERKIMDNILENCGGLPIISVSQKPIDFGENICVGEMKHSYHSEWKQIITGAKAAKTEYLVFAESDFLYPKEYFEFEPKGIDVYRYDNVWIVWSKLYHSYHRKPYSEGAQIVKRKYAINRSEDILREFQESKTRSRSLAFMPFDYFHGDIPAISFKTKRNISWNTTILKGRMSRTKELPHWGNIESLKEKYL